MTHFNTMIYRLRTILSINLSEGGSRFVGVLLIAVGLFNLLAPEQAWYFSKGWQFKDAEPSDGALYMGRISGVVIIILGIFLLF